MRSWRSLAVAFGLFSMVVVPVAIWLRRVPSVRVVLLPAASDVARKSAKVGAPLFWDECDGQSVCIDGRGDIVLRPTLGLGDTFIRGYSRIMLFGYRGEDIVRGLLDDSGGALLVIGAEDLYDCSEGMARFEVRANRFPGISYRYGFVAMDGTIAIPPVYSLAGDFSEGLARVNRGASNWDRGVTTGGKWGYVDASGTEVISISFLAAGDFSHGLAPASKDFGSYGYIDKSGTFVIAPSYEQASEFSEGLASVRRDSLLGFINTKGDLTIGLRFAATLAFSEGLAAVWDKAYRLGYIDTDGRLVIPFQFDGGRSFSGGLAPVNVTNETGRSRWGYINKEGRFVIDPVFSRAEMFRDGIARVVVDDGEQSRGVSYIDRRGQRIYPCEK